MQKNIDDQIQKQIDAGFTPREIIDNLHLEGFTKDEINAKLKTIKKANGVAASSSSSVSAGRVFWVILIVIIFIVRMVLRSNR